MVGLRHFRLAARSILCVVNKIIPCLDGAGYDDCSAKLILMYAAALMATSSGARRIKSQGAPSGASRSFDYGDDGITWLRDSLAKLDTSGCTSELPISAGNSVGLFMVVGAADGVGFSSATDAADVYPGVGDHRYRPTNDGVREKRRQWFINCDRIRATGAVVLRWRMTDVGNRGGHTPRRRQFGGIRDADGSDTDGGGQPYGWEAPIAILCDYRGWSLCKIGDLGRELVVKNTIWTEYATAREGDYILIGASTDAAPPDEADEIRQIVQFADTFERLADDFALITESDYGR